MAMASAVERAAILESYGAGPAEIAELQAYSRRLHEDTQPVPPLPMADEPHIGAWEMYAAEARKSGAATVLRRTLVQFSFPISHGISATEAYRMAVRRGVLPDTRTTSGFDLRRPEGIELFIHPTVAGRIPILVAPNRDDFETLVRALTLRNEPQPVPPAMGACMVSGLVNWDRVRALRRAWEASGADEPWEVEFQRIVPHKELYQDRFIVLSQGPYSGVPASDLGLPATEWLGVSHRIRLEHECTHYATRRIFGSMQNNLLDELVADFMGLTAVVGRFPADWFLRFLGLDAWPTCREDGRIHTYRGDPPLSVPAFVILQTLIRDCARNLQEFSTRFCVKHDDLARRARLLVTLASCRLEDLATPDVPGYLGGLVVSG